MAKEDTVGKWYHFGRWVESLLAASCWLVYRNSDTFRRMGFYFITDAKDLDGHFLFLKNDLEKLSDFVRGKLTSDHKWFEQFFGWCDGKAGELAALEGGHELEIFFKRYTECLSCSLMVEFVDHAMQEYLEALGEKTGVTAAEAMNLMRPYKKTELMEYQDELRGLKEEMIVAFVRNHKWIGTHGFGGEPLNEERVMKEIVLSRGDRDSGQNLKVPAGYEYLVEVGSKLAYYRTYLVEKADRVAYSHWPVIKELAEKQGLSWDDVNLLTHVELIELTKTGELPVGWEKRREGFGVNNINGEVVVVAGDEMRRELRDSMEEIKTEGIEEIKGMTARGGRVKGVVRVVERAADIGKLNEGEILVAPETTPDYVVGMKMAGAIVTNQGGITSHAAIVSRELGVPCVIGTKIATQVLKDGDLVEVDADKGVVKIIKRAGR